MVFNPVTKLYIVCGVPEEIFAHSFGRVITTSSKENHFGARGFDFMVGGSSHTTLTPPPPHSAPLVR